MSHVLARGKKIGPGLPQEEPFLTRVANAIFGFETGDPRMDTAAMIGLPLIGGVVRGARTGSKLVSRMLAREASKKAEVAGPEAMKWMMDKSGKITFGPTSVFHDEMFGQIGGKARVAAAGVVENNRVKIYRDLARETASLTPEREAGIKQAVARAYVDARPRE